MLPMTCRIAYRETDENRSWYVRSGAVSLATTSTTLLLAAGSTRASTQTSATCSHESTILALASTEALHCSSTLGQPPILV